MTLVVDACVLKAAGVADKPTPVFCRAVLEAILKKQLTVSASQELIDEWRRHPSGYARLWLTAMFSRRRVERVGAFSGRAAAVDHAINHLDEHIRVIAEKDSHLLKIALDHGRMVISLEDRCRRAFVLAAVHFGEIKTIVWVNPLEGALAVAVVGREINPPRNWYLS